MKTRRRSARSYVAWRKRRTAMRPGEAPLLNDATWIEAAIIGILQEVSAVRCERVDQSPGLQRLDAMHQARRHDEGAALFDDLALAVDRHLEASLRDIARLHMRMRMQRADA